MERLADDTIESFMNAIEERLAEGQKNKIPFSRFLEEKMDAFDYSNTSLAKKVFHRVEKKKEGTVTYVPVTRQAIGAWLRGSMPSSRDIYVTLGMAFQMNLEEINHILLENYMGYGLYCKNIDDALWIALINGLFSIDSFEAVREKIEDILEENDLGDFTGITLKSGFCEYPLYVFNVDKLRELCPKQMAEYEKNFERNKDKEHEKGTEKTW